mmetsp:Transcript_10693/g.25861  ORF Transcript_10693/g.25861 Transcript_10693/m.25861 type:complete len:425 (+) Transcript_10693:120-1394(+)
MRKPSIRIQCFAILLLLLDGSSLCIADADAGAASNDNNKDDSATNFRRLGSNLNQGNQGNGPSNKSSEHKSLKTNTIRGAQDRQLQSQLQDADSMDIPLRKRMPAFSKDNLKFSYTSEWRQHFLPSSLPSEAPSHMPSDTPSFVPSEAPSNLPSQAPSDLPSIMPSEAPSDSPSVSKSPSVSPSETPSASPSRTPIRIACAGDSLTLGQTGLWNNPGLDYPTQLGGLLGGNPFSTHNYGRNVVTAISSSGRSYNSTSAFRRSLLLEADIYLLMLGTNDARIWESQSHMFATSLEWIINEVKRTSPDVRIMLAIPPWVKMANFGIRGDTINNNIRPIIQQVAAAATPQPIHVVDMYAVTKNRYEFYTNDGIHLNGQGYEMVAQAWKEAILCNNNGICETGETCGTCEECCPKPPCTKILKSRGEC